MTTTPPNALPETRGLDHVVLCVRDFDAAVARYRELGFTTTPRAEHPWGTANCLVQMDGNFIELLTVAAPEKLDEASAGDFSFGGFCQSFLDDGPGEGMAMLVFESADAEADQAEFREAGLDSYPTFSFSREAKLPDGGTATVGFTVAFVTHPDMARAAFFTCEQHAPEHFWKPDYQQHDNGAARIQNVVMVAENPADLRDFFGRLQTPDRVRLQDGMLAVATNRGHVTVMPPRLFADAWPLAPAPDTADGPRFALIEIGVPGLAEPYLETAFGVSLAFKPAS